MTFMIDIVLQSFCQRRNKSVLNVLIDVTVFRAARPYGDMASGMVVANWAEKGETAKYLTFPSNCPPQLVSLI